MQLFCAIVLCCAVAVANAQFRQDNAIKTLRGFALQCQMDVHASDADIESIISQNPNPTYEAKCLRGCVMEKMGLIAPDGKLYVERMVKIAIGFSGGNVGAIRAAEQIGNFCMNAPGGENDPCEMAFLYDKCLRNELNSRRLRVGY